MDRTLERLLTRQGAPGVKASAPILEINAGHALIRQLAGSAKKGVSAELGDAAHLLLDMARVLDGETVSDPAAFAQRLGTVMQKGL
jgi:molecular chaperone HtpG